MAGFLGLEPLEHVTALVGVVPAAESIAPDESEAMGMATVYWVLGLCPASVFPLHCLLPPLRLRPCSCLFWGAVLGHSEISWKSAGGDPVSLVNAGLPVSLVDAVFLRAFDALFLYSA